MIKSMPPNDAYRDGWDKIWGNKCVTCNKLPRASTNGMCSVCIHELFSLSASVDHSSHGRGTIDSGPDFSDCCCRELQDEEACAAAGCGFCIASIEKKNT